MSKNRNKNKNKKKAKTPTNKQKMQNAARARHAKFKQTRVQTFGGKKTSFSKSEQKRITDAGYSVSGYSKAKPNTGAGTAAMVAADNAQYGNTVPAGSFGISAEGRAQAEANKAEAARKVAAQKAADQKRAADARRASAENARRIASERAAAEAARKAEAARVKAAEEKRQRQFDPGRLSLPGGVFNPLNAFTPEGRATMLVGGLDAATDAVNFGKNVLTAGYAKDKFNVPKLPKYQDAGQQLLRNVSSVALPLAQGRANIGRFKSVDPISGKAGFANEIAKMTTSNAAFKAGKVPQLTKAGISNVNPATFAKAFTPQMVATGPTAGATIALNTAMTGATVGDKAQAGGLNIGGSSAEGKPSGLSRVIAGAADAVMRDTTDFDKRGVGNPASFGLENTVAGSVLNAAAQETGTINQFRKDTDNFSNLTNFNKLSNDEKVKTAQNVLKFTNDSQAAQALGEGLGLGKDFKSKINNAVDNVQGRLEGVTADRNSLYGVTSDFARDIGTDPDLNPINKFLTATATDNLGEAGKEKNILGMTNEMARDIKAAFQEDSPTTRGLSAEQRGIVGSFGNRILSGKATDGLREATYGYGGREGATNAGLTEGQPLNFSDIQNTAVAMRDNLGTGTTLASQRFDEAKRLVTPGGVTAGSLIRGSLPRFGGRTGSSTTPLQGTGTTGGSTQAAPMEELPIYQTAPTTTPTQTGTDTSNLQQIQQQSYIQNLARLGITDLRSMPQFRANRRAPRRFRSFRRGYF